MILTLIVLIILGSISVLGLIWAFYKILITHIKSEETVEIKRIQGGIQTNTANIGISDSSLSRINALDKLLKKTQFSAKLNRKINSTGSKFSVGQLISSSTLLFILVFLFLYIAEIPLLANVIFSVIVALSPYGWIQLKFIKRQNLLEKQLPDILDFIARSMLAGHDFNSALRLAAHESPNPIGGEFQITFDEINFGGSIHDAMQGLASRILCPDIRYFVIAILINREIGGDVATLLKDVASLIRERLTFKDTIYAMTAEGRMSAIILGAMPFVVGLLIFFVRPEFISILWTDEFGRKMLVYTFMLMLAGAFWMRQMIQIRV